MPHRGQVVVGNVRATATPAASARPLTGSGSAARCNSSRARSTPSGRSPSRRRSCANAPSARAARIGVGIGAGPGESHRRHDDGGAEHAEGGGDHLAGHLTEQAPAAGEVGGTVGQCDSVGVSRAGVEAEGHIVPRGIPARSTPARRPVRAPSRVGGRAGCRRDLHGPPPYVASAQHYGLDHDRAHRRPRPRQPGDRCDLGPAHRGAACRVVGPTSSRCHRPDSAHRCRRASTRR